MQREMNRYIISNISLPFNASFEEAFSVARAKLKKIGVNTSDLNFSVFRRSIDARKKQDIRFVYSILVTGCSQKINDNTLKANNISCDEKLYPTIKYGHDKCNSRPVVVGTGPCGLFCALLLAENGFRPIVIERGGSVDERVKAIENFKKQRTLDTNTNIQFGAGGAGTFSDGKLITRINDSLSTFVIDKLVEFGAPSEISYLARPHVGTDVLMDVVKKAIDKITELGGEVIYHNTFLGFESNNGRVSVVKTTKGDIECSDLVLAIGHSARDTYEQLITNGISIEAKSFSVGMRIEHPATLIDTAMYGENAGNPILGHAEYNLSYNTKERGVYTFCMCPGGVVVAATSELDGVVSNGMSYHARDGKNSNSAVCCTIFKEDYGSSPLDAIAFQRKIERAAFVAGGSDYSAPIVTVGDFLNDKIGTMPSDVMPTYMDGTAFKLARPSDYLPSIVTTNIKNAIYDFDKKIHGFAYNNAVLTGAETRTSAPVRITRDNELSTALGFSNFYPAGEGAGYAGGITSAAIDGVKTAMKIISKYAKN